MQIKILVDYLIGHIASSIPEHLFKCGEMNIVDNNGVIIDFF
jgi:hypothetical protein